MKILAVVLAALLVAACSSSPKIASSLTSSANGKSAEQASKVNDKNSTEVAGENSAPATTANLELSKLNAELQQLQQESNFFDYAKFAIKPEYQDVIRKQAEFLKAHSNDLITLAGNADERGSEEYNHDLGNKRANAVKKSLEQLGVPAKQIKTVSLGKDKPRLSCHEEKCWKENRRVDFKHSV